jgi:ABC-type dipeptide/oligopeptide/nickel transport system ATPase component
MTTAALRQSNPSISWGEKFSSWFNPYHALEMRIKRIAANIFLSPENKADLQRAFDLAHGWTWPAGRMKKLLSMTRKEHIQELLDEWFKNGSEKEITIHLERYLSLLNQKSLLKFSKLNTPAKAASWFHSRGLIKNSALKSSFEKEGKAIFKEFWIEVKYFFFHILDILVGLLGVNELGERKHNHHSSDERMDEYQAIHKIEAYGRLIGFPAILFGFIYTYIQFKTVAFGLATLGAVSTLVALVAYQRFLKPCPKDHYGLKNLTIDTLSSNEPVYPRHDIAKALEGAFKEKKGVILVGEPGSGKSSTPCSLVEQMEDGKICTFIKNPQVFSCGASKFKSRSYDSSTLDSIAERFKKYKEQVIFFFDEAHAFFKKFQGSSGEDDLKMFCEIFKYVILATTVKEFNKHIKNQPAIVDRRFIVIKVGKLDEAIITIILSQFLQTKHPKIKLGAQVIEHIVRKAETFNSKTSKIDAAQSLLNRAITEMRMNVFKDLEMQIGALEDQEKLLDQQLFHAEIGQGDNLGQKLEAIRAAIRDLKDQLAKKNRQAERMNKIEGYVLKLKEQSFRMADPAIKLDPNSKLGREWIALHAKIRVVADFIARERKALSLPQCLDRSLIDKILKERNSKKD